MHMLVNHCWCSDSNWGGHYNCRVIVQIDRIAEGNTYYDPPTEDWTKLTEKHELEWKKFGDGRETIRLKAEVLDWLKENVKDRPKCGDEHVQGWAIGTDKYNSQNTLSFTVFFERTSDGLRFIKRWSSHKKPVSYLNYFRDTLRKLDPKTNRLRIVKR